MALENYTIRQIDYRTAMDVIVREHYLHRKAPCSYPAPGITPDCTDSTPRPNCQRRPIPRRALPTPLFRSFNRVVPVRGFEVRIIRVDLV